LQQTVSVNDIYPQNTKLLFTQTNTIAVFVSHLFILTNFFHI